MTEINRTPGAYRQENLEAMDDATLALVRDMADEEFNSGMCSDEEYFEMLAGAADEILMWRAGWF